MDCSSRAGFVGLNLGRTRPEGTAVEEGDYQEMCVSAGSLPRGTIYFDTVRWRQARILCKVWPWIKSSSQL